MKRIILILCVLVLTLMTVSSAFGEANDAERKVIFLYFPTEDAVKFRTIQYLIKTQTARWKDATTSFANMNGTQLSKSMDNVVTISNKKWTGNLSDNMMDKVQKEIAKGDETDLWLLIQEESVEDVFNSEELKNWLSGLMKERRTFVHFALVGDHAEIPAGIMDSLRTFETYCDIEYLSSDFLAVTTEKERGTRHTGDCFIASLYGTPMDLPMTTTEAGGYTFTLPETSQVFLLRVGEDIPTVTNESAEEISFDEASMLKIDGPKPGDPVFYGKMTELLPAGTYTLQTAENETDGGTVIKGYWYPDLEGLTVDAEVQDVLLHGANNIHFTLSKDYGRHADMTVEYTFIFDDEELGMTASAEFTEENGWNTTLTVDAEKQSVRILPTASLYMEDGNLVFSITGDPVEREIQDQPVSLQEETPKVLTLYLDQKEDQKGTLHLKWSDFFRFNPADYHEFDVETDTAVSCFEISERDEEGFSITAVAENHNDQMNLIVSCDEMQTQTVVVCVDIEDVFAKQIHIVSDENGLTLKPGDSVTLRATFDETIKEVLIKAREQGMEIPELSSLRIRAELDDQDQETGLSADKGKEIRFELKNEKSGEKKVCYKLFTDISSDTEKNNKDQDEKKETEAARERIWNEGQIIFTLQNNPPALKEQYKDKEKGVKIPLHGVFGKTERIDLLNELFEIENPCDLFDDEETGIVSVTLEIEGIDGLEIEKAGQEVRTVELPYTFESDGTPIRIWVASPGTHTLKLTATDGCFNSDTFEVPVSVYSLFMQYLTWAGIALGGLLLIIILVLVIRQARKPSFDHIKIRCLVISDEDQERCRELMNRENAASLISFGKKPVSMNTALILTSQPPLSKRNAEIIKDITLLPSRHEEIMLVFGKEAMRQLGKREKKELISQGNVSRIRLDGTWLQIENVR